MLTSNAALVAAELPQKAELPQRKDEIAECGPMSLQNAADSHGHEMHPQKFIRLVGCHGPNAGSHEDTQRLH